MPTLVTDPTERDGEFLRSWYSDDYFDLIVWKDEQEEIASFQLCYNRGMDEYALTWKRPGSYYHQRVDDGENRPGKHKATPVLVPDGKLRVQPLAERFQQESAEFDPELARFVHAKLLSFPSERVRT